MKCQLCGRDKEDLNHFILWCPAYDQPRQENKKLQQPYEEQEKKCYLRRISEKRKKVFLNSGK